ncbi:hypothetical protein [Geodermatophilus sp. SYSU D00815]
MARLTAGDIACWVLKTAGAPPPAAGETTRCVRRSYRLELMAPGQPCLLWRSGRDRPGVHALGVLTGRVRAGDGGPVVPVRFTPLAEPVDRADLLADPTFAGAEVVRMPAGSNPSWLSPAQYAAVLARV